MTTVPGTTTSRDRILEAAIELIDTEGESGVKVDRIAEVAQVAKPSLYHYFGDREGLIVAAQAERYHRSLSHQVANILDYAIECETQEDFATLILRSIVSFVSPEGAARRRLRIQVLGSAATRPDLRDAVRTAHQYVVAELAKVFAYGQRRGWVHKDFTSTEISEWWYSLITGRHIAEVYGGDAEAVGWVNVTMHTISLLLFGKVFTLSPEG